MRGGYDRRTVHVALVVACDILTPPQATACLITFESRAGSRGGGGGGRATPSQTQGITIFLAFRSVDESGQLHFGVRKQKKWDLSAVLV